jgi:uncharacterized membrane protein
MFSYQLYNVVHIVGIVLVMAALGGAAVLAMTSRASHAVDAASPRAARRLLAALHGAGAFLIILGGFGMLARLGLVRGGQFPGWLWVKIAIWLVISGALVLPRRVPGLARPLLLLLPVLGGLAAYMAIYKPV